MRKIAQLLLMATLAISGVTFSGPVRAQSALTDGLVTKIDASANKITIKHGSMKKFGMDDGMTMVYAVKDPALLTTVKSGDKIKFDAENVNGQFIVTKIRSRSDTGPCRGRRRFVKAPNRIRTSGSQRKRAPDAAEPPTNRRVAPGLARARRGRYAKAPVS